MIRFIEHHEPGYAARTVVNARSADLTIAFAVDFTTAGERLTHKAAYGKYFKILLRDPKMEYLYNQEYRELLNIIRAKKVTHINIAGNGIYTLTPLFTQESLDELIYSFLKDILRLTEIQSIRSGGQTGVDEAALKAGDKLGLDCTCLAPKNWLFRDINGNDHMRDPDAFCARFGPAYTNDI